MCCDHHPLARFDTGGIKENSNGDENEYMVIAMVRNTNKQCHDNSTVSSDCVECMGFG